MLYEIYWRVGMFHQVNDSLQITFEKGNFVIISITGVIGPKFIAEVKDPIENKMRLKVVDNASDPYSNLKPGDFIIDELMTTIVQSDQKNDTTKLFDNYGGTGKLASGLKSLDLDGINLKWLLPVNT